MTDPAFAYREIPLADCTALGRRLQEEKRSWHIHVLAPDCRLNPKPGLYAFVIEDNTGDEIHVAFSEERPREPNLELLKLLHGDAVLDEAPSSAGAQTAPPSPLAARVRDLHERGIGWHHHMHFPDCKLNPHPGRWAISLEADDRDTVETEAYDEEPHDVLSAIEIIYFSS